MCIQTTLLNLNLEKLKLLDDYSFLYKINRHKILCLLYQILKSHIFQLWQRTKSISRYHRNNSRDKRWNVSNEINFPHRGWKNSNTLHSRSIQSLVEKQLSRLPSIFTAALRKIINYFISRRAFPTQLFLRYYRMFFVWQNSDTLVLYIWVQSV